MKKPHVSANLLRRLCAAALTLAVFFSAMPSVFAESYSETYLSLYYAEATMEEGKFSKDAERFFSNIAAISMADLPDEDFLSQLGSAVDSGYKYRVFVLHEQGMPTTDLAMLYCFQDASWLLKDTTSVSKSVYLDVSWEVMQGIDLRMAQQELIRSLVPDADGFYECKADYVWQIFMEFVLFIEERNKAIQQMLSGSVDQIPELPEEIDGWPLDLPVSVQLPKELTILDACFTVEPADSAAANFEDIPESQRFEGTVGPDNLVTGTLRIWEAGPHLVRLVFTASINGQKQSLSHNISIDTSSVRVSCPLHEDGHHWEYEWAEEHPHKGRFVCDCGAVMEDPTGATRLMIGCCECIGHEWVLSYSFLGGEARAVGRCRRCGNAMDMTDSLPDYIRNYLDLLAETGAKGNTYFDEHNTGDTPYLHGTAPWVYIADQSLTRYTNVFTTYKEAFVNTLADPIISAIELVDGEYDKKIDIESKTQLLWIQLIQEMLTDDEQDVSAESEKAFIDTLDVGVDITGLVYDMQTDWLESVAEEAFTQSYNKLVDALWAARSSLDAVQRTTTDPALIIMEQDKVNQALEKLEALKQKGPDYKLADHKAGEALTKSLPHIMNAISALMEGCEAGEKVKEMRSAYISMLNDYSRSRTILSQIREDAAARGNKDLEAAVDTIADVLDTTYQMNCSRYFDATVKLMDSTGNELATADEAAFETFGGSFLKKETQTVLTSLLDLVVEDTSPLVIATIAAKITKGVSNYDEIFDASTELSALSLMHSDASISLGKFDDQVSPYTLALYAKLESEGFDKAADFVDTLTADTFVDDIMKEIIGFSIVPNLSPAMTIVDAMDVDVREFGIGSDEKETVVLMLRKEKLAYDDYMRQCLQDADK